MSKTIYVANNHGSLGLKIVSNSSYTFIVFFRVDAGSADRESFGSLSPYHMGLWINVLVLFNIAVIIIIIALLDCFIRVSNVQKRPYGS